MTHHPITHITKSIAAVLFLCGLITSCGGITEETTEAHAAGTPMEVSYGYLSGTQRTIRVDDIASISVVTLLENIKAQDGIVDSYCSLVVGECTYDEDDGRRLKDVLDVATIDEAQLSIIVMSNAEKAQRMLGDDYVGLEAWQKFGISEEEIAAVELPTLPDAMLAEIKRLQDLGQQPLLVLDLGYSIADIERLCQAQDINLFSYHADVLRSEACYQNRETDSPTCLLLPGSDHGVLPGSRNKCVADQVQYMEETYPLYEVGGVRELVTIVMLKYIQDGTVLFSNHPCTLSNCKEYFEAGHWKGYPIRLGGNKKEASGSLVGLVVVIRFFDYPYTEVGCFAVWRGFRQG